MDKPGLKSLNNVEVTAETIWLDISFSQKDTAKAVVGLLSDG